MEKEFVPYKEALELKEMGFNESCFAQYRKYDVGEAILDIGFSKNESIMQFHKLSKFCSAPTFSQAFRWFRDKYKRHYSISINNDSVWEFYTHDGWFIFDTYEEAELECLRELIKIVKNENR